MEQYIKLKDLSKTLQLLADSAIEFPERSGWISVEEKLPDVGDLVLVTDGNGLCAVTREEHTWALEAEIFTCFCAYTHWMAIPPYYSD